MGRNLNNSYRLNQGCVWPYTTGHFLFSRTVSWLWSCEASQPHVLITFGPSCQEAERVSSSALVSQGAEGGPVPLFVYFSLQSSLSFLCPSSCPPCWLAGRCALVVLTSRDPAPAVGLGLFRVGIITEGLCQAKAASLSKPGSPSQSVVKATENAHCEPPRKGRFWLFICCTPRKLQLHFWAWQIDLFYG